jgi:hypothetical protein
MQASSRSLSALLRRHSLGLLRASPCQVQTQARTVVTSASNTEANRGVYKHGRHRSDAEQRIAKVPIIMVDGDSAVCTGGEQYDTLLCACTHACLYVCYASSTNCSTTDMQCSAHVHACLKQHAEFKRNSTVAIIIWLTAVSLLRCVDNKCLFIAAACSDQIDVSTRSYLVLELHRIAELYAVLQQF